MRKSAAWLFLLVFFVLGGRHAAAQSGVVVVQRLADVETIYLDENSFQIKWSSCGTSVGGLLVPCQRHQLERQKFFAALSRWLGKYNFALTDDRQKADAVLQGDLSIDDDIFRRKAEAERDRPRGEKGPVSVASYEPYWSVRAWLTNQDGNKLWTSGNYAPMISYKSGGLAKIEAKKLASALQYDFKKSR